MKSSQFVKTYIHPLFTRSYWQTLGDYVGIGKHRKFDPVRNSEALAEFLGSRASHVAQASLYGYLRTRAGTRFPQMFENPDILTSINIAKWHVWLACLGDLSVFAGQCLRQSGDLDHEALQRLMPETIDRVLTETGEPEEAGPDFESAREKLIQRIGSCDWNLDRDDDTVFSASPEALYYWSPIAEELKERDETIVKNSIRFRWIEVRRLTRRVLDGPALAQSLVQAQN